MAPGATGERGCLTAMPGKPDTVKSDEKWTKQKQRESYLQCWEWQDKEMRSGKQMWEEM